MGRKRTHELKAYEVNYVCDTCKKGHMQRTETAIMIMTDPPLLEHQCDNPDCAKVEKFTQSYPTVEYVRVAVVED